MTTLYENDIYHFPCGTKKVTMRLVEYGVREFLDFRVYYLGFEEEWLPTKEGFRIQATLETVAKVFDAFVDLLSDEEVRVYVDKFIKSIRSRSD